MDKGWLVDNLVFCIAEKRTTLRNLVNANGATQPPFFYAVVRKEQVGTGKKVVLRHKFRDEVYCMDAPSLAIFGVTIPGTVTAECVEDYDIFVQSTSPNRKLDEGEEACFFGPAALFVSKRVATGHKSGLPLHIGVDPLPVFRSGGGMVIGYDDQGEEEMEPYEGQNGLVPILSHVAPSLLLTSTFTSGKIALGYLIE
jgi:hypothetical protein